MKHPLTIKMCYEYFKEIIVLFTTDLYMKCKKFQQKVLLHCIILETSEFLNRIQQ